MLKTLSVWSDAAIKRSPIRKKVLKKVASAALISKVILFKNSTKRVKIFGLLLYQIWFLICQICSYWMLSLSLYQCDQIGRYFIVLGNKFSCKSSLNTGDLLGYLGKDSFLLNTAVDRFGQGLGQIGLLIIYIWSHCNLYFPFLLSFFALLCVAVGLKKHPKKWYIVILDTFGRHKNEKKMVHLLVQYFAVRKKALFSLLDWACWG